MSPAILDVPGMSVYVEKCPAVQISGPQEVVGRDCFELCLVSDGCFQYRDGRGRVFVDPTTAVLAAPGQLAEMAHPAPGGDQDTLIFVCPEVFAAVGKDIERVPLAAHVTPAMHLTHRRLLAAGRAGRDPMLLEELTLELLAAALEQDQPSRVSARRPSTRRARRQLIEDARAALTADPTLSSVTDLASRLGCSPHHLSRVFHEHTGTTLGGYRMELRVARALAYLADDAAASLADVAARCGFADQAHLTRTMRRLTGATPTSLRAAFD